MKRVLRSLALVAIAVVSLNAAKAQNPHFVDLSWDASSLTASGKVAGLGNNQGITITVDATVSYNFDCRNPSGHAVKPFTDIVKSQSASVDKSSDKNGMVLFTLSLPTLNANQLAAEYCPNPQWKVVNIVPTVMSASISVTSGNVVILSESL